VWCAVGCVMLATSVVNYNQCITLNMGAHILSHNSLKHAIPNRNRTPNLKLTIILNLKTITLTLVCLCGTLAPLIQLLLGQHQRWRKHRQRTIAMPRRKRSHCLSIAGVPNQAASYYVYLSIIELKLTSESAFKCFVS